MSDLNKELTRKAFDEIWNKANFAVLDQIYAADYVHRASAIPETAGLEPAKQLVLALHAAFPDGKFTVENMVSETDTVVARWRFTGTQQGEWLGIPATGKPVSFTGTSMIRFAGGKIAEQLSADWDVMAMSQQLGLVSDLAALAANKALVRPLL